MNQDFKVMKGLPADNVVRRHFDLYGRVQGVGFRYTAYSYARSYGLTGWVRNCSDGHVEMVLQGNQKRIQAVISSLREDRWIRVDEVVEVGEALKPEEKEFKVTG